MHPLIRHEPDPEHPGWWSWEVLGDERFNATIGRLIVRGEGDGRARCRMFPGIPHSNLGNVVHGGAILTFIDMAMFAGGHMAGMRESMAVTLDCSARFIAIGELGHPLDATVEIVKESGRLVFFRGIVEQEGRIVADWSGTLRKIADP